MSTLTVPNIQGSSRSSNTISVASGHKLTGAAGSIAAPGQIIQVVTATDSTERTTTSTSYVAASNTLSVSLTPSSASNKVFVTCSLSYRTPGGTYSFYITIFRNSTDLSGVSNGFGNLFSGSSYNYSHETLLVLDSPNTTSSVTYQPYFRVGNSAGTGGINNGSVGSFSTITAFEVAG